MHASPVVQMVKICLQCRRPRFDPWIRMIPWRGEWQPIPVFLPGEFHGQRSHGVARSQTQLSDLHTHVTLMNNNNFPLNEQTKHSHCLCIDLCFSVAIVLGYRVRAVCINNSPFRKQAIVFPHRHKETGRPSKTFLVLWAHMYPLLTPFTNLKCQKQPYLFPFSEGIYMLSNLLIYDHSQLCKNKRLAQFYLFLVMCISYSPI